MPSIAAITELLDKLGSGTYEELWQAKNADHKDVALTRMFLFRDPATIYREITLQSSKHPNSPSSTAALE